MEEIRVKRLSKDAIMPKKSYGHDAGYDLCSVEDLEIKPGERKAVKTGIAIEMPLNYHAEIRPKSGISVRYGVTVLNSPGTVDPGYLGEIRVILVNLGNENHTIKKGDKIAQLVFSKVDSMLLTEVEELHTQRGEKGFGSSGV